MCTRKHKLVEMLRWCCDKIEWSLWETARWVGVLFGLTFVRRSWPTWSWVSSMTLCNDAFVIPFEEAQSRSSWSCSRFVVRLIHSLWCKLFSPKVLRFFLWEMGQSWNFFVRSSICCVQKTSVFPPFWRVFYFWYGVRDFDQKGVMTRFSSTVKVDITPQHFWLTV